MLIFVVLLVLFPTSRNILLQSWAFAIFVELYIYLQKYLPEIKGASANFIESCMTLQNPCRNSSTSAKFCRVMYALEKSCSNLWPFYYLFMSRRICYVNMEPFYTLFSSQQICVMNMEPFYDLFSYRQICCKNMKPFCNLWKVWGVLDASYKKIRICFPIFLSF